MRLIQNAIRIVEDGKIIKSCHVHDYVTHTTSTGKQFMLDGGTEYVRSSEFKPGEVEELHLSDESSAEEVMDKLVWGTYGPKGDQPLKWVFLKECSTDHLQAILKVPNLSPIVKFAIDGILDGRKGKVEVLEIKDEILTKEVSAFKGSEVEKCGNYLIIPSVPEIHPSAALPYGRFFKAKVFKQNKKLVYHNPYTGAEHLVSESNHTFVKV